VLAILTTLSASSCGTGRPKFNPDAHRANHYIEAIVNEEEKVVYCYEEKFSEFACMHKSKWVELRQFVHMLKLPTAQKRIILESIDHAFKADE
jgi:hypothetical protein